MAEYWMPDMNLLKRISSSYKLHVLTPPDFENLYIDSWSNALCVDRKILDVLAVEIGIRNKVPFYCCAWSNIRSAKTAIKAGFRQSWVEMTVKTDSVIEEMIR